MANPYLKQYLMTAGPTPLPPEVSQVMAEPMLYHRAPAFVEVYARVLDRLKLVFGTTNQVLLFAGSGSGAMESAVANLVRPGEPALVASCGKFGERFAELCDAYGAETVHWETEWGQRVDPTGLDAQLAANSGVEVVFTTLSETSTGVVNDVRELTEVAHGHGALIAVDAVSGLGAVPCPQDEWGIDVLVSGSQKALMAPPGLGFASPNAAAIERAGASPGRRYYFDWERTLAGQRKDPPDSPFTPAVGLVQALDVALGMIEAEGLDQVYRRHDLLGRATRAAARALDLELLGGGDEAANVVTAIALPDGIDGSQVPKLMRERFKITIAGGQGRLKGRIARIAHCGYFGPFDIIVTVSALEMTLARARPRGGAGRGSGGGAARPRGGRPGRLPGVKDARAPVRAEPGPSPKVLVKETIGDSGVALLRDAGLDVELGVDWADGELERRIGEFDAILIRSATKLTAELLARAHNLKAVGRAGVGVDNVDVDAATKRGVIVANAPQSNVITAAEHTLALLLALARKVPQAHGSLTAGAWERSRFSGVELYEKTLGVLGFGRIGQLVAQRALGFGMHVVAFDAYVAEERFRDVGVERAESSDEVYAAADFLTIHLPVTEETENWLDSSAFAKMKDGVRVINVARGKLLVEEDLREAIESGKVAGAALDVFRHEPMTESPLFGLPNVVVTPHLGASTEEATDRAGYQAAEQVVAALTGGMVTSAVNVPAIAAEDLDALGPFLPLACNLGAIASTLAERTSVDSVEVEYLGRIAERDTRLLTVQVLKGVLSGHTEEDVNDVNAPTVARERGIAVSETSSTQARDFTDLVRVSVVSGGERTRVVGTTLGRAHRPHLLEAWGSRFNIEVEAHWAVFRYEDRPGMLGRVGTELGNRGINIVSAAVGRRLDETGGSAVMIVTADSRVPQDVVDGIVATDGFVAGRTVSL